MIWVVLLIVAGVIVVAYGVYKYKNTKEDEKDEISEDSYYVPPLPKPPATPAPKPVPPKKEEKSLDRKYAEAKGLWVCPYCETLNENTSTSCAACGMQRT